MQGDPTGRNIGGSASAAAAPLSPDEVVRRRRLAALDDSGAGAPPPTPPPATASFPIIEDEDGDLQTALALSLQEQNQNSCPPSSAGSNSSKNLAAVPAAVATAPSPSPPPAAAASIMPSLEEHQPLMTKIYDSGKPFDVLTFHKIMWDDQLTTESDKNRWVSQGIDVRRDVAETTSSTATAVASGETMLDVVAATHLPWGLVQHHGGPCGVLAAIQAEMLRMLLFAGDIPESPDTVAGAHGLASDEIVTALARSIGLILARATLTPPAVETNKQTQKWVQIVLPTNTNTSTDTSLTWQDLEPWHPTATSTKSLALTVYSIPTGECGDDDSPQVSANAKRQKTHEDSNSSNSDFCSLVGRIHRLSRTIEAFLLDTSRGVPPLDCFRRHGGVLLLVMSLAASRPVLQDEFDDPAGTRLTAQFGHCGQELINLLLTGQAVSNVFDNTLKPSGEMVCRGIQSRSAIGYLSQLESMRYCEVGGFYKSPIFPIWVVGSTSHFTVLFSDPAALKESKSDKLLDECRRAFKSVEGGEENGFIATEQLGTVLKTLNIDVGGATQDDATSRVQTLAASLEVGGAGIILWDDFWKAASRLLTGASLEAVLQGGDGSASSNPIVVDADDRPLPLITNYPANPDLHQKPVATMPAAAAAPVNYIETDEEMARRLAAEWGESGVGMSALSNVASAATPMEVDSTILSDEEMARKLQQQWDSESIGGAGAGGSSVAAVSGSPVPTSELDDMPPPLLEPDGTYALEEEEEDSKPAASTTATKDNVHAFEQYGDSFALYHYNGLRGGILTPFRITRLSAEEAVGASIALNRGAGGSSHGSGSSQDLEDVVRTKWPSCAINWLGKQPPYID